MLATLVCAGLIQQKPMTNSDLKEFTLLIFTKGQRDREYSEDELKKMQADHQGNMGRLYHLNKAHIAGPLGEAGDMRGILLLDMPKDEIKKEMLNDPYVKHGLLKYELHPWITLKDTFSHPKEPEDAFAQFSFVIAEKGDSWSEEQGTKLQEGHLKYILQWQKEGKLAAAGPTKDHKSWRGFYIFYGNDLEATKKLLNQDKMFSSGHLKAQVYELWMGKGLFKNSPKG